jgi:predicted lipoprotein
MRVAFLLGVLLFATLVPRVPLASDALATRIIDRHVVPGYQALVDATARMDSQISEWCTGAADGDAARDAFADGFVAWARIQHIDAGPIQSFDRRFRMQFWPDPRSLTTRRLSAALGHDVDVSSASVAIQGFPALERLVVAAQPGDDACRLATAVARNIADISSAILEDWIKPGGFREEMLKRGPAALFQTDAEALRALVSGVQASLQAVSDVQLGRPVGKEGGRPRPKRAEAWRTGLSLDLIRARLAAANAFYLADGGGLDQALRTADQVNLADLVLRAFAQTRATAGGITLPLMEVVTDPDGRRTIRHLMIEVRSLRALLSGDVAAALGIPFGFNRMDGD